VTNISSNHFDDSRGPPGVVERQRELGRRGAVMNGRDIGTVVFLMQALSFF